MALYQRESDKAAERDVAGALGRAWQCEPVEFPAISPIDWYMKRGTQLVALVEIKERRNRTHDAFKTVMLNSMKALSLVTGSMAFSCPAYFVIRFTDGIFWINISDTIGMPTAVRGRTDRGDRNDIEPCVEIPVDRLKRLNTKEK